MVRVWRSEKRTWPLGFRRFPSCGPVFPGTTHSSDITHTSANRTRWAVAAKECVCVCVCVATPPLGAEWHGRGPWAQTGNRVGLQDINGGGLHQELIFCFNLRVNSIWHRRETHTCRVGSLLNSTKGSTVQIGVV